MDLSDDAARSIVAHLAHLRAEYGAVLAEAELVEPNATYFPDAFALDAPSIDRLLRRMMTYAPLSTEISVGLGFVEPGDPAAGGGCGSGACGEGGTKDVARGGVIETEEGYGVLVPTGEVGEAKLLTTCLARSIGRLVLHEADEDVDARDEAALSELTAVACGFGVILLNGACVYKKGCGGVRRHQGTALSIEELSLAAALFARVWEKKAAAVRRHLEITQTEAFDAALAWVDSQPRLVASLRDRPETLTDGIFPLEGKKGLFSRLFAAKSKPDEAPDDEVVAKALARRAERTDEERRRIAETKRLVEEAFQEG